MMKRALILGGSGFIGMALTRRLVGKGYYVRAVDNRHSPFGASVADDFHFYDLRKDLPGWIAAMPGQGFDEVYQLACDMGGAGYIFTGEHDAEVMYNNVLMNANVAHAFSKKFKCDRVLYTSSSCIYSDDYGSGTKSIAEDNNDLPPSNGYGAEKLFSEKLFQAHAKNYGLNVCITRFSTIYGPGSAYDDGREKAVAAICRKVIDAPNGGEVEVWGDGEQVRPLVYIDDLLDAMTALMRCKTFNGPVNIANSEFTTCNEVARQAIALSGKRLTIKNVPGPIGKQILNMTTDLAEKHLGWRAKTPFSTGLKATYEWIAERKSARKARIAA